jgi:hypothetical protein
MQQRIPKCLGEESKTPLAPPQESEKPMTGKALTLWRLKRMFWGKDSITVATLLYTSLWFGLVMMTMLFVNMFRANPVENMFIYSMGMFCLYLVPSLISAIITAKVAPRWSTLAIGLFSGGFIGFYLSTMLGSAHNGGWYAVVDIFLFLTLHFIGFRLAQKIRKQRIQEIQDKK